MGSSVVNPQFERSFATLAYAFVQEKAQKLMPYLIGFQVIYKNDDDTRAAGAFGFKIGSHWMYAPSFFINGDLKGSELLYVKTPDLFIPMQENWINFILSHDPKVLGTGESRSPRELGVLPSDLRAYYRSPLQSGGKSAMAATLWEPGTDGWLVGTTIKNAGFHSEDFDIEPLVSALIRPVDDPELASRTDLKELTKDAEMYEGLAKLVLARPSLKEAISKFYDGSDFVPGDIVKLASGISDSELSSLGIDRGIFNFYVRDLATRGVVSDESDVGRRVRDLLSAKGLKSPIDIRSNLPQLTAVDTEIRHNMDTPKQVGSVELIDRDNLRDDLTDKEAEALMLDGYTIRDNRKESSQAYDEAVLHGHVFSPIESGVYSVLGADNAWHTCLVVINPRTPGKSNRIAGYSLVVCGQKTALVRSGKVLASQRLPNTDFKPDTLTLSKLDVNSDEYVIISPDMSDAVVPCTVRKKDKDSFYVSPESVFDSVEDYQCSSPKWEEAGDWLEVDDYPRVKLIIQGPRVQHAYGMLMLTEDWRAVKVKSWPGFECGTLDLAAVCLAKKASLTQVTVSKDRSGYVIQVGDTANLFNSEKLAVWNLVNTHGLTKDAALEGIRRADKNRIARILVKHAVNYYGPSTSELDNIATYNEDYGYPVVEPRTVTQEVDGLKSDYADESTYSLRKVDQRTMQAAEQAAASGEKEVMDLSVMASLVKAVDINRFTSKYLKDLTRGLDRVGRILFLYYWHYDKFTDRYGEDEMHELESGLQNTFRSVGDVVLFLKKRTVEPERILQGSDVSLDNVAGTGN